MVSGYQIRFEARSTDWLGEAMTNSPADDGWTKVQWEQILMYPQQFDLEDLEEVRVNAMQRAKACAKKALAKGRVVAKEWATMAMTHGAKLIHRWTGRIGTKPQLADDGISFQDMGSKAAEDT